ncbi:MAG: hypothetical protein CMJ26_03790 [Phycisphaerae bacterium]|nr:hypothetical protein [Phycisphaerae bacterium]
MTDEKNKMNNFAYACIRFISWRKRKQTNQEMADETKKMSISYMFFLSCIVVLYVLIWFFR